MVESPPENYCISNFMGQNSGNYFILALRPGKKIKEKEVQRKEKTRKYKAK